MHRHVHADGAVTYRSSLLEELDVPHAFTTKLGPGAEPFDADLCDVPTLARLADTSAEHLAFARQVHGARVIRAEDAPRETEADALVSDRPGHLVAVVTADCVPLLLASADGRRVAAVHAGWRGLVAAVIPAAIEALAVDQVAAAIGPCLSLEHFEVGEEVAQQFEAADLAGVVHRDRGPKPHVDLRAAASVQLERAGVTRIDVTDRCTWNDEGLYSYRRDVTHGGAPRTGRLAAIVGPRD